MKLAFQSPDEYSGWGVFSKHVLDGLKKRPAISDHVTLHAICNNQWSPLFPDMWNKYNVGFGFVEDNIEGACRIGQAVENYDAILVGSAWNASWAKKWVPENYRNKISHFTQGIDTKIFKPAAGQRTDRRYFTVFIGGKAEIRKGTDIALAALSSFAKNHNDVRVIAAIENQWGFSQDTLALSKLVQYKRDGSVKSALLDFVANSGLPPWRIEMVPAIKNSLMPIFYQSADVGLFPNRCEAGENQVLKEAMACGLPCIASEGTGHLDILPVNGCGWRIPQSGVFSFKHGIWPDFSVEDTLALLEAAYNDRQGLSSLAERQYRYITSGKFSWDNCVDAIYKKCEEVARA